jgi:hypothetical protein
METIMTEVQNDGLKDVVEIELADQYHVTLHAIQFQRDHQDHKLVQTVFEFRLHSWDGNGWTTSVSTMEQDDSLDELYRRGIAGRVKPLRKCRRAARCVKIWEPTPRAFGFAYILWSRTREDFV